VREQQEAPNSVRTKAVSSSSPLFDTISAGGEAEREREYRKRASLVGEAPAALLNTTFSLTRRLLFDVERRPVNQPITQNENKSK